MSAVSAAASAESRLFSYWVVCWALFAAVAATPVKASIITITQSTTGIAMPSCPGSAPTRGFRVLDSIVTAYLNCVFRSVAISMLLGTLSWS